MKQSWDWIPGLYFYNFSTEPTSSPSKPYKYQRQYYKYPFKIWFWGIPLPISIRCCPLKPSLLILPNHICKGQFPSTIQYVPRIEKSIISLLCMPTKSLLPATHYSILFCVSFSWYCRWTAIILWKLLQNNFVYNRSFQNS